MPDPTDQAPHRRAARRGAGPTRRVALSLQSPCRRTPILPDAHGPRAHTRRHAVSHLPALGSLPRPGASAAANPVERRGRRPAVLGARRSDADVRHRPA